MLGLRMSQSAPGKSFVLGPDQLGPLCQYVGLEVGYLNPLLGPGRRTKPGLEATDGGTEACSDLLASPLSGLSTRDGDGCLCELASVVAGTVRRRRLAPTAASSSSQACAQRWTGRTEK
jgi:hypothetical protein